MLKTVICVVVLMAAAECRYTGDSCTAEGQLGFCAELHNCPSLEEEIRAAGSPMPHHMAFKLQQITCGYNSFGPLVCCVDTSTANNNKPPKPSGDINDRPVWGGTEDKQGSVTDEGEDKSNSRNNNGPPNITGHQNLAKLPSNCGNMDTYKIANGNRTALYEMPWMVLLYYNTSRDTKLNCGGTLINEWYVLTAAHCVSFLDRMELDHVILGEWDVRTDPDCDVPVGASASDMAESCAPKKKDVGVSSVIPHPGYRPQTLVDDIALIRLAEPADLTLDTVAPICLPVTSDLQRENLVGKMGTVAGWGVTEFGLQSPVLLQVDLTIVNNADCQDAYRGSPRVHDTQMCAGGDSDKDSCGGDSGGPLLFAGPVNRGVKQVQRGVVSYGSRRCGVAGLPGVYTNVAYYMDWILNNIS